LNVEPLRVLFLVSTLGFGGAEKHTVTLANRMDRNRFRCALAYLKPNESLLPQLDSAGLDSVVSLNAQSRIDRSAIRTLSDLIDRLNIDVIVCVNEYPTVYAWLAARRARRRPKLVEIFHTTVFGTIKDRLQMCVYRQIFRRLDLLIYVSRNQQRYWHTHGLRATQDAVVHNGIDCDHYRNNLSDSDTLAVRASYGFSSEDYVIGICAALRPEKAHLDLVSAIVRLHAAGIPARCMIIGDGPQRTVIERRIASLNLSKSVVITGMQSDIRVFMASCDVCVLSSHAVETFSLAALEAMAMGKPLVLSNIGGADEQVLDGQTGYLYPAGDVGQLANRLELLANGATRARMGAAALARVVKLYAEAPMIERYQNLLQKLCAQTSTRI
jgi:glycosyltransferase involved in cell wall biosynthesis